MRLFVALEIPDDVRENLRGLIAQLQPKCQSARWIRSESMHLTLKFIGHVAPDRLGPVREILSALRMEQGVEARFGGLGFFPNKKRARVVWAGVHASPNLGELAAVIDRSLTAIGVPAETRPFSPHITLARLNPPANLAELAREAQSAGQENFGSLATTQFQLFESKLKQSGAEYTGLARFSFCEALNAD